MCVFLKNIRHNSYVNTINVRNMVKDLFDKSKEDDDETDKLV